MQVGNWGVQALQSKPVIASGVRGVQRCFEHSAEDSYWVNEEVMGYSWYYCNMLCFAITYYLIIFECEWESNLKNIFFNLL